MTYRTQPGTLPHRVVELLKSKPPGTALAAAVICEELGVPDYQVHSLSSWMASARKAGAVKAEPKPGEGRLLYWSLGDGTPLPQIGDDDPEMRSVQRVVPAAPPPAQVEQSAAPAPVCESVHTVPESVIPAAARDQGAATTKPRDFDAWLSGSTVQVVLQGVQQDEQGDVVLTPEQAVVVFNVLSGLREVLS